MSAVRFEVEFYNSAAKKDYDSLDGSVRPMVDKGLARLALRADEIGKTLSDSLAGCRELKFRANGIRIVYRICSDRVEIVQVVAIGGREKEKVFRVAAHRLASS